VVGRGSGFLGGLGGRGAAAALGASRGRVTAAAAAGWLGGGAGKGGRAWVRGWVLVGEGADDPAAARQTGAAGPADGSVLGLPARPTPPPPERPWHPHTRARPAPPPFQVPVQDNYYAALNSAVFSDGSFVYVPKGVRSPMELSTYFRINASETGQVGLVGEGVGEGVQGGRLGVACTSHRTPRPVHRAPHTQHPPQNTRPARAPHARTHAPLHPPLV
jgi:hypothetical protein